MKIGSPDDCLYLVASVHSGIAAAPVKIGITRNINKRVQALQTACPQTIRLYEYWECGELSAVFEGLAHDTLDQERMRGEWFDVDPETARMWIEITIWLHMAEWAKNDREFQLKIYSKDCFGSRQIKGELGDWRETQQEIIEAGAFPNENPPR